MTKVAIYGMVRLLFDLVGPVPWWWGVVITLLGGITAVLGVLRKVEYASGPVAAAINHHASSKVPT